MLFSLYSSPTVEARELGWLASTFCVRDSLACFANVSFPTQPLLMLFQHLQSHWQFLHSDWYVHPPLYKRLGLAGISCLFHGSSCGGPVSPALSNVGSAHITGGTKQRLKVLSPQLVNRLYGHLK